MSPLFAVLLAASPENADQAEQPLITDQELSSLIYSFLDTNPTDLEFSSACAVAVEGLVLGVILAQTARYLSNFFRSDSPLVIVSITFGALTLFGQFGLNLWQTYCLIDQASHDLLTVIIGDVRSNMTVLVIVGIMNFVAAAFFGRRAWSLAGRKTWLLCPLAIGILSSLGLSLGVAIKGFMLPSLAGSMPPDVLATRVRLYDSWRKVDNRLIVVWATTALAQDIVVCGLMTTMLLRQRAEIQRADSTLLRLLLKLTYETMAGPVILNVLNVVVVVLQGATFAGYSRIVTWILGPVYYSSILQSLNYRTDVQRVLRVSVLPRSRSRCDQSTLQRMESSIPLPAIGLGNTLGPPDEQKRQQRMSVEKT
ncbi:hypothetical protein IAU60_001800 [Kwoniella sp. DSM 27419]